MTKVMQTIIDIFKRFSPQPEMQSSEGGPIGASRAVDEDQLIDEASKEFSAAVAELHSAQRFMDNVDPQDVRMVDEAIARLNVARLRVDNATRRLKTLLGIPLQEHRPQEQVITERISAALKMPSSEDGAHAVC